MKTEHLNDHECRAILEELYCGYSVVLPISEDHARAMIQTGSLYLNLEHEHTLKLLKANYDN